MFQEYALFPHKNVFDNVAFGLRHAATSGARSTKRRVAAMLALVGLQGFAEPDVIASFPAASANGWPWPAAWPPSRAC